jgi:hypothetical protein
MKGHKGLSLSSKAELLDPDHDRDIVKGSESILLSGDFQKTARGTKSGSN